jgi:thymidylate synthase
MLGDTHIYQSHLSGMRQYLEAAAMTLSHCPSYVYNYPMFEDEPFTNDAIQLIGYDPLDPIEFELH